MKKAFSLLAAVLFGFPAYAQVSPGGPGLTSEVCVAPTVTANTYSANNTLGGLLTFSNITGLSASGVVQSVRIQFKDTRTEEFDLYLFSANPSNTTWTDRSSPTLTGADLLVPYSPIRLTSPATGLGAGTVYGLDGLGRSVKFSNSTLYGVVITPNGTTSLGSSSDVQICVTVMRDN